MPLRLSIRWSWLLPTLVACALFIALGRWQWQRGEYRSAEWQRFETADVAARDIGSAGLAGLPRYTRVRVRGAFDAEHQILIDNISEGARAGYYVLTVLRPAEGPAVLVNRGWVAGSGYRERLPDVALAAAEQERTLVGRVGVLPVAGIAAGRVPPPASGPWPRVASFPTEADVAAVLPYALSPGVLLLEPAEPDGFVRTWHPPGLEPARHYSYAVQWWAFAALALVLFVVLNVRRKSS